MIPRLSPGLSPRRPRWPPTTISARTTPSCGVGVIAEKPRSGRHRRAGRTRAASVAALARADPVRRASALRASFIEASKPSVATLIRGEPLQDVLGQIEREAESVVEA